MESQIWGFLRESLGWMVPLQSLPAKDTVGKGCDVELLKRKLASDSLRLLGPTPRCPDSVGVGQGLRTRIPHKSPGVLLVWGPRCENVWVGKNPSVFHWGGT